MARTPSTKRVQIKKRVARFRQTQYTLRKWENEVQELMRDNETAVQNDAQSENKRDIFQRKLKVWAIDHKITQRALADLLKILFWFGLNWLCRDPRTFLCTPRNVEIVPAGNGKMSYFGIANNLSRIFSDLSRDLITSLNINIDGLPLFNSSKYQFWPILASIHGMLRYSQNVSYMYIRCMLQNSIYRIQAYTSDGCGSLVGVEQAE